MIVSSRRRDRRRRLAGAHVLAFTNGYAFLFLVGGAVVAWPRHFSRSRKMAHRFVVEARCLVLLAALEVSSREPEDERRQDDPLHEWR